MHRLSDIYTLSQLFLFAVIFIGAGFVYGYSVAKWFHMKRNKKGSGK